MKKIDRIMDRNPKHYAWIQWLGVNDWGHALLGCHGDNHWVVYRGAMAMFLGATFPYFSPPPFRGGIPNREDLAEKETWGSLKHHSKMLKITTCSWKFQPIQKISVKLDHFSE